MVRADAGSIGVVDAPAGSGRGRASAAMVRQAIDAAEPELRWCWSVLARMRRGEVGGSGGRDILAFQGRLVGALDGLEGAYRAIKREEKRLVASKGRRRRAWLAARMARLESYSKAVRDALAIGRAIGDGFAWLFYEQDRDLVIEHLQEQRQLLLPPGVGAIGEKLALQALQGWGRHLLIYHGATTFLRLGDISLVDLETLRVAGLGEIKTQKVGAGEYRLRVELLSSRPLPSLAARSAPEGGAIESAETWPPEILARLQRQVRALSTALKRARAHGAEAQVGSESEFHYDSLNSVARQARPRRAAYVQAGPSLVIAALRRTRGVSLGRKLLGRPRHLPSAIAGAPGWALKIMTDEIPLNALTVGGLGSGADSLIVTRDSIPFACWGANERTLEEILFRDVVVSTFYNPAHLTRAMRDRGFELSLDARARVTRADRMEGGRRISVESFSYFYSLTQHHLMSHDSVLRMIDLFLEVSLSQGERACRVTLDPRLHRGPPRFDVPVPGSAAQLG